MGNEKLMAKLRALDGAVNLEMNPLESCLQTPSPSVNWSMAVSGHGLPFGSSMLLYGPPKGGKSIICNSFIGQLHQDDPESVAIVFNTEQRGRFQSTKSAVRSFGIDPSRFVVYDVSEPAQIFDRIEKDIADMCQQGLKIKLIVVDSLKNILGRRLMNAESVDNQLIGDQAATIQDGLLRILSTIRKYDIAFIMTTHIRSEMDATEQRRGKTVKAAAAFAAKHMAEFFCWVEPNQSKDGRKDLAGEEFVDQETKDFMDNALRLGHKIRFRVDGNSLGPAGRTAEFTLNYTKGIINQYEEIFLLGKNTGVITKPNNLVYEYKEHKWNGLKACLTGIRDSLEIQNQILGDVYKNDKEALGC